MIYFLRVLLVIMASATQWRPVNRHAVLMRLSSFVKIVGRTQSGLLLINTHLKARCLTYSTYQTAKAAPMPLAPPKAHSVRFSVHHLTTPPADTHIICPFEAVETGSPALDTNTVGGNWVDSPAKRTAIGIRWSCFGNRIVPRFRRMSPSRRMWFSC